MQDKPLVSVLINNYNYGRYLDDAVSSVLSQTYGHVELIVVDDGSTDNSADVLKKYEDWAIIVYKENGGQASAFNVGFAHSKGDIICFLDSDDVYTPGKVQKVVETFLARPSISYCFDKVVHTDENMVPLKSENRSGQVHYMDHRAHLESGSLHRHLIMQIPATSGLSFRREMLNSIFPIAESESCSMCENYMKYVAVGTGQGAFLETSLTLQRIHGDNLFTVKDKDPSMTARISILTGYWLNRNFPQLAKFADTQVALGMTFLKKAPHTDSRYRDYVREHLKSRGFFAGLLVRARSLYYSLKER